MRYAAAVDANQPEIVKAFRRLGCKVAHTHMVGKGFPDLVVSHWNVPYLIEVKASAKSAKTDPQIEFHEEWPVHIVRSTDDVASLVSAWEAGL